VLKSHGSERYGKGEARLRQVSANGDEHK